MLLDRSEETARKTLAAADERGAREAHAFVVRLEKEEIAERDALIDEWKCVSNGGALPSPGYADAALILRLKSENEGLQQFRHAVVHSRSWRCLQFVRRLVGRAW